MLQRLDSWMLTLLGLALVGCGSTNTVLDATSLYTRGENQSALDVLSEAKSNSKNQQWATLQEVTVALDASQFERAARAVEALRRVPLLSRAAATVAAPPLHAMKSAFKTPLARHPVARANASDAAHGWPRSRSSIPPNEAAAYGASV